jgi:hypothetical protein
LRAQTQKAAREEGSIHLHHRQELEKHMDKKLAALDSKFDKRFEAIEKRLEKIADAVGVKKMVAEGNDDEDRKRLKERLNEALGEHRRKVLRNEEEIEGWTEYIFGICKPNGRLGKHGSRSVTHKFLHGIAEHSECICI